MPSISVVIPTLNEEKYLGGLLDDLTAQTIKPYEVIVSDCNSIDKTLKVARSYKNKLPLKLAHSDIHTPGAARNTGAKLAAGDYLLFLDADMILPSSAIELIDKSLKQQPVDFVTPKFYSDGRHPADSFLMWIVRCYSFLFCIVLKKLYGIGGFILVKRSIHAKAGGFNEKMNTHDDIDYNARLKRVGASFTYLTELKVKTSSRRFQGQNLLSGVLRIFFENSLLAKWLFQPTLQKMGKGRKYGHYE